MTKIIALSDTHLGENDIINKENGRIDYEKTLGYAQKGQSVSSIIKNADWVLHAGDIACQKAYNMFYDLNNNLKVVKGGVVDNDIKDHDENFLEPYDCLPTIEGVRVGLVHQAFNNNFREAMKKAVDLDAQVLVFGHIHHPLIVKGERMLICPGCSRTTGVEDSNSPVTYRGSRPSMAQLIIKDGLIDAMIIPFKYSPVDYQLGARKG
jgi:putative phosphoesterase